MGQNKRTMDHSPELLVYKASAGSGKTFTLAVEYIKLLIQNPRAYRNILAVTFTNKATAEMKERILSQLYGIWTKDKDSDAYLQVIMKDTDWSEEQIRSAAGTALNYMIHDYSRFRVETIDSFFLSVLRNLARELELGANLDIELDNSSVLSDAVDSMIEKLERNSPVLSWLMEYIEEHIDDNKRWNVSNEIKGFGRYIFDEKYIEKGEGLREKLRDKNCIRNYRKTLKDIEREALEQMKGFAEQFIGILETNGLHPEDLKNGSRGIASYFNKLQNGNLDDSVRNATVEKCLDCPNEWTKKTSAYRNAIMELAETELIPLLNDAEKYRRRNNMLVNSCLLSLRYTNNIRLLANIDEEVRELNHASNRFLLSDINALLHNLVHGDDPSFVFEKIGTTIRNVMIDEFQDTSRMQWGNFKLLLLEGLSQGADSLIVGDVKQSIYRWRGGDWGILNSLKTLIDKFPIRVNTLDTNRRSAGNIILFNNEVFVAACHILNNAYREEQVKDCVELKEAYSDVCQKTCKEPGKGYVKITFLSDKKEEMTYVEDTLQQLAEEVESLVAKGIRLKDIAILVRWNRNIPQIADYFDKHTTYKIVSDEAFRLDASLAVCMIMDGLRYLSDPENRIAKAQLAAAYQNEILQKNIDLNTLLLNNIDENLPSAFIQEAETLQLMSLYELMEKLFTLFEMSRIGQQDAYLCAFFDAVMDYQQKNSSELSAFIAYWDETLCGKTIPSGEVEGIRILSIHKSKGLEYHTVLLPFCDWKMENERYDHLVWCIPREAPFNDLDLIPVNYSTAMQQSIYQDDFLNERLQLWVDNLNLLYVAFTRAKKNLIVWGKAAQTKTVSELLTQAMEYITNPANAHSEQSFQIGNREEENGNIVYESGELYLSPKEERQDTSDNKLLAKPQRIPVHLEALETHIEFKQSNRSAEFINGEEENKYIQQGQLMHNLFSIIHTTEDIPSAIERLRFEGIIESAKHEEQIRKLTKWALNHPLVKDWFSGCWNLYNECAIIYQKDGELETRRPDRVMMKDGKVVVVDFKFGKKRTSYNRQVREYMNLLANMGYQHIQGYLWYVFNNELEEIK